MINKGQKHKSKNSKSTKTQKHKNTQKQNKKHKTKNKKHKNPNQASSITKPEGEERKQGNGKRNGLLWCLVPYVWEFDLLISNHV